MSLNQERIAAANRAYIDALGATLAVRLNGVSRPVERHFHTAQAVLADVTAQVRALSAARDFQDVPLLRGSLVRPGIDDTVVYLRSLLEIAGEVRQHWERIVGMQLSEVGESRLSLTESAARPLAPDHKKVA